MRSRLIASAGAIGVAVLAIALAGSLVATTPEVSSAAPTAPVAVKPTKVEVIGKSVRGQNIVARLYGSPTATRVGVIIGSMHGTELAGFGVVRNLSELGAARGTALWVVRDLNPDGSARGQRKNARGVDLNRNGSHIWKGHARAPDYYPGPRPLSEPETRTYVRFLTKIKPDMVIVYHQRGNGVDSYRQKNRKFTYGLAARMGLPVKSFNCDGECTGTLTGWFNTSMPGTAITVELPARVSSTMARRYAIAAKHSIFLLPDR